MSGWDKTDKPDLEPVRGFAWVRVLLRGTPLAILVFGGLVILLLVRLLERPFFGMQRPITPWITVFVCKNALRLLGLGCMVHGRPMKEPGILVANHASWLDIFVLNASGPLYFVSKSEVARWPGIGWLARATGTVFIQRDKKHARAQTELFAKRLLAGHRLLFFPEGTSTDGLRVLPFKSTLFQSLLTEELRGKVYVQPVSVRYRAPDGCDARFYGWWGDMDFASHLLRSLAAQRQGAVALTYHAPIKVSDTPDRKVLARESEKAVRAGHETPQISI